MARTKKTSRRTRRKVKDKVLQARIPDNLDEELRTRAEQLGLSVSTLVRNVLFNTFDLVDNVVSDSAQISQVARGRESPPALPGHSGEDVDVVGWQEAVLNKNGVCEECNAILTKGTRAAVGVPVQARPLLLCQECLATLSDTDDPAK